MALYAIFPGSIYYSRTFQPDGAMVFFLAAALYAWSRWIVDDDARIWRGGAPRARCSRWRFLRNRSRCWR